MAQYGKRMPSSGQCALQADQEELPGHYAQACSLTAGR